MKPDTLTTIKLSFPTFFIGNPGSFFGIVNLRGCRREATKYTTV